MKKLSFCSLLLLFCCQFLLTAADIGSLNWDKAIPLDSDILYVHATLDHPRLMEVHAVRVDLRSRKLGFFTTPKPDNHGKPMPDYPSLNVVTKRQSCRNFLKEARRGTAERRPLDMILAVNGSPWSPWERPFTHQYASHFGLFVSAGEVLEAGDLGRPAFVVLKDGSVDFYSRKNPVPMEQIEISVPGFGYVLIEGGVTAGALADQYLAPRTGYGLSQDRDFLYIVVIDGRQKKFSQGATTGDVGRILKQIGAWDGLNMDGGGSTSLVFWDEKSLFLKGNRQPSGDRTIFMNHQPGGAERRNGNNLGIYRRK